jgi:hypothetical protein
MFDTGETTLRMSFRLLELRVYIADSVYVLQLARDVKCEEIVLPKSCQNVPCPTQSTAQ